MVVFHRSGFLGSVEEAWDEVSVWCWRVIQERWLRSSLLSAIIPNYEQLIETVVAIWLSRDEIHDWIVFFFFFFFFS